MKLTMIFAVIALGVGCGADPCDEDLAGLPVVMSVAGSHGDAVFSADLKQSSCEGGGRVTMSCDNGVIIAKGDLPAAASVTMQIELWIDATEPGAMAVRADASNGVIVIVDEMTRGPADGDWVLDESISLDTVEGGASASGSFSAAWSATESGDPATEISGTFDLTCP